MAVVQTNPNLGTNLLNALIAADQNRIALMQQATEQHRAETYRRNGEFAAALQEYGILSAMTPKDTPLAEATYLKPYLDKMSSLAGIENSWYDQYSTLGLTVNPTTEQDKLGETLAQLASTHIEGMAPGQRDRVMNQLLGIGAVSGTELSNLDKSAALVASGFEGLEDKPELTRTLAWLASGGQGQPFYNFLGQDFTSEAEMDAWVSYLIAGMQYEASLAGGSQGPELTYKAKLLENLQETIRQTSGMEIPMVILDGLWNGIQPGGKYVDAAGNLDTAKWMADNGQYAPFLQAISSANESIENMGASILLQMPGGEQILGLMQNHQRVAEFMPEDERAGYMEDITNAQVDLIKRLNPNLEEDQIRSLLQYTFHNYGGISQALFGKRPIGLNIPGLTPGGNRPGSWVTPGQEESKPDVSGMPEEERAISAAREIFLGGNPQDVFNIWGITNPATQDEILAELRAIGAQE